jgi:hypothetical protein
MCYLFSGQFAKLATLRYTLILPSVLGIIYIGAFEGSRNWGDLYALLLFGVLGWTMKQMKWPRPPFILGFVLGDILERYLFISIERYGTEWLIPKVTGSFDVLGLGISLPIVQARWAVLILFVMAILSLLRPVFQTFKAHGGLGGVLRTYGAPRFGASEVFALVIIAWFVVMVYEASFWNFKARIVPTIVGTVAIGFAAMSLLHNMFSKPAARGAGGLAHQVVTGGGGMHMDLASDTDHIEPRTVVLRAMIFFGWLIAFMASMATIGLIPTVPLFVIAFMRIEGRESWRLVLPQAIFLTLFIYVMFDQLLTIPWPPTLLGDLFPGIKGAIPSL